MEFGSRSASRTLLKMHFNVTLVAGKVVFFSLLREHFQDTLVIYFDPFYGENICRKQSGYISPNALDSAQ